LYSKKSTLGIITNTEIILNWKTESQKSLSLTLIYFRTFGKHWFIYTILNSAPNNTYFSYFTYYDDIQICVGFQPPIFSFTFTTFCIFSITNFYENLTWLPWYILLYCWLICSFCFSIYPLHISWRYSLHIYHSNILRFHWFVGTDDSHST
jgi:hypothetical protein